ncbi:transcriptional regulator [Vreelandella aquamarina]|jgi:DNA-binding transcriptional LysR family regulator|uniref:Transcriptional regulator n=1 Tax=Vreelandella aquamarina TaxID=77097 RepID=A0A6F8XFZ5_9GAMM|nr:LysR family transcriptional regulator [Halomonas meridiana]BCB72605.1 transcriptional regulator [Halomonas meridiana]
MHFDIPDLRMFIHVAEAASMTAGARRANISTAAASTRIKTLEGRLNTRLFYRDSQGVELTPAGQKLLKHARAIMRQVEYVKSDFSDHSSSDVGHIKIFANTTAVTDFMPEVLANFLSQRPAISIDLQERLTNDIFRGVLDGAADFGVTSGEIKIRGLEALPFSVDRLVVVVPKHHPISSSDIVSFQKTLEYPYVGLHEGSTLLQFLKAQVEEIGVQLPLRIQVYGFEAACRMIEAGVGIGVLPESSAIRYQKIMSVDLIHLEEAWASRARSIVVREYESLPESSKELIREIKKFHQ